MDVKEIQNTLAKFADDRDWNQYHSPKNLSMALAVEAAELMEIFQWLKEEESRSITKDSDRMTHIAEEIADIQIYLLRLADILNLEIENEVLRKIKKNAGKYPI